MNTKKKHIAKLVVANFEKQNKQTKKSQPRQFPEH